MVITIRLNKANKAPNVALLADQELTDFPADTTTYWNDAKAILDFMLDVLPSGTVDRLANLMLEATKTQYIRPIKDFQ